MSIANRDGRGGKGRIFVFAAGNSGPGDNCNYNDFATSKYSIAVGAVSDDARQASYSESCSALFISAPSGGGTRGIVTTDLSGAFGYDASDYTISFPGFSGTSAAAPVVSGAIALILSANPNLTQRDVKHILARSAVRIDPTDSGWTTGPLPHNEKYGFGLVDARAAVELGIGWTNVQPEITVVAEGRTVNRVIPDNDPTGIVDTVTIGPEWTNATVEHVQVDFTATHSRRGNLEVTLTSPSGMVSHLGPPRPGDDGSNFNNWHFRSVRHWGESPVGTWTLRVADRGAFVEGVWNSWFLTIFGTDAPPVLTVTPASLNFGSVALSSHADLTLLIQNSGRGTLTGTVTASLPFTIMSGGTFSLGAGESQTVTVRFTPTATAMVNSSVEIVSNASSTSRSVGGAGVQLVSLTVTSIGSGTGSVTSTPPGISCGQDCSESYTAGALVLLAAVSSSGSRFGGWGGACSGTGACLVTLSTPKTVNAAFVQTFPLTVSKIGNGSGTVTSVPAGIDCGPQCASNTATYDTGQSVTLTTLANAGSIFLGWSGGGCAGAGSCVVTIGADTTVTATFAQTSFTLSFTTVGSGGVNSSPAGIVCGATCAAAFAAGTVVTLTATPTAGATFSGWSGACTGTSALCVVTMTQARSATATFATSVSVFADDPLVIGVTIKAVHVTDLRVAIDHERTRRSLAAFAWTDSVLAAGVTHVKIAHLVEMRTALSQAYQAAGRTLPTYTDPAIVVGQVPVRATHIGELRAAVRALQ